MSELHCFCGNVATGTVWVSSKDGQVYECEPACDTHREFRNKNPHGFIPGMITADVYDVQEFLFSIEIQS